MEGRESKFSIKIGKEKDNTDPKRYDNLVKGLEAEDNCFKNGYQSIFSDGTLGLFVDNYKIDNHDCGKDHFNPEEAVQYQQIESSRFIEFYKADIK